MLEAEHGTGRAGDVLRWLRGPAGVRQESVDWLERSIRRRRARTAAEALDLWLESHEELPYDLRALREAEPARPQRRGRRTTATRMAARFLAREGDGPAPGPGDGTELRAAATISGALAELGELGALAPGPEELIGFLRDLTFRVWSGPVEGRVRIADPRRLRASRFDHVVDRLAPGRRVPAPRRRRSVPLRHPARVARPRPAARRGRRGALPLLHEPLAGAPQPRPLLPRMRRGRRRRGPLAADRRRPRPARAAAPGRGSRPGRGGDRRRARARRRRLPGVGGALGGRARPFAGGGRGRRARRRPLALAGAGAGGARGGSRPGSPPPAPPRPPRGRRGRCETRPSSRACARCPPTAARRWSASTSAPTSGSPSTSCGRGRWTPSPMPCSRAGWCTRSSTASTASRRRAGRGPSPPRSRAWSARAAELVGALAAEMGPRRAPGRASDQARRRGPAAPVPERGSRAAAAPSSRGCWRRSSARRRTATGRRSSSTAGACTGRSTGSTAAPDGRLLIHDYKVASRVTAGGEVRGGGEAAAAALRAGGARALGRGARSAPSTTRCAGPGNGARGASSSRRPARTSPPTRWSGPTSWRRRGSSGPSTEARERASAIVARMRERRHPPRPRPARRACATTTSAPPTAPWRRSAAATARRSPTTSASSEER